MLKTPYTPRHYFPSLFHREMVDNKKKIDSFIRFKI